MLCLAFYEFGVYMADTWKYCGNWFQIHSVPSSLPEGTREAHQRRNRLVAIVCLRF